VDIDSVGGDVLYNLENGKGFQMTARELIDSLNGK
jgi:hypothetical protein